MRLRAEYESAFAQDADAQLVTSGRELRVLRCPPDQLVLVDHDARTAAEFYELVEAADLIPLGGERLRRALQHLHLTFRQAEARAQVCRSHCRRRIDIIVTAGFDPALDDPDEAFERG